MSVRIWVTKVCLFPLVVTNRLNSYEVNSDPLSETSCSVIPYGVNHDRIHYIVFTELVEVIGETSTHFEYESISTRNICLFVSAKSTHVGHIQ